jgi:hypothetical protein
LRVETLQQLLAVDRARAFSAIRKVDEVYRTLPVEAPHDANL